ncbi:MAG: DNRLRE domain-containing protein, partial [Ruminococcaceae bacterium]|nr:DNRLRE domain-containing protein [Oscillospiraceae bacterium]
MMKKYTKITAMVLSLLIFAYCIPFNVFATDTDSSYVSETESAGSMVEESIELVENDVIGDVVEVVEMRQENVKHFRLADGTYEAIIYPQAVHRKDENGVWQDIDNDLKLQSLEGTQKYATRDHRVRFSKNFEFNNQLFSLNENGYAISMTLVGTDNSLSSSSSSLRPGESPIPSNSPSVVNPEKDRSDTNSYGSLEEAVSIDNKSSIIYSGVKANTDIEYVLQGNDIKENIIVNATSDSYEYLFVMELVGLTAQLDTVGNVKITDSETGQSKYIIPAPYMYDNNGIYSYDVHYELAMMSNGRYALGVVADEEWINADGRAFPVTIDPTLTLDIAAFDSYTDPYPNNSCCYGYSEELWISDSQTTYIQIDMPELPTEATINDVQLHISYYYNDNITYGTLVVGAYQILENWEEHLINHDNAPSVSTTQLSTANLFASTGISASNPGPASFDITDAAVSWHAGTTGNYGIALKHESGSNESVVLKSYESGEDYPYISVNYSYYLPDGVYAIMSEATRHWITVESDSKYAGSN